MEWLNIIILACQIHTGSTTPEDVMHAQRACQRHILNCIENKRNETIQAKKGVFLSDLTTYCIKETGK